MSSTKTHQGVGRVATANQRPANFEIKIGLGASRSIGVTQIEDEPKEDGHKRKIGRDPPARRSTLWRRIRTAFRAGLTFQARKPQKPDDLAPTPHEIPQLPKKACEPR